MSSSSEIVVAEPFHECASTSSYNQEYVSSDTRPFTRSITYGRDYIPEPFDSEKLPVTLVSEIQRFLRVANLIEFDNPRVAYICRFHAFEVAHNLDRNSSGRGVRQFKTSLLQRLEQDEEVTIRKRKEKSDIRELKRVFRYYKDYIIKHGGDCNLEHRQRLIKYRAIASVLREVLDTVTNAAGSQALADGDSIRAKSDFYVPYNILPLDQGGVHQAIMQLPEIKFSVAAVRNVRGLPFIEDLKRRIAHIDLFDWLQFCFGFQKGNVSNQREHLILLLANTYIRQSNKQAHVPKLGDVALDDLMKKFFKNYTEWCKFLERKSNIRLPYLKQEAQQYKLLYIGLYLLIWGEAANLRFMPECLCYIFHHMAYELHSMLIDAVSMTGEKLMPAYGGESESFLNNIVFPIYKVIQEEAMNSSNGTTDHSKWRNYDDLNEYFWSPECFQIGWPMRQDHDFFFVNNIKEPKLKKTQVSTENTEEHNWEGNGDEEMGAATDEGRKPKWLGKTNFVEVRSFLQIFRSFDRMWSFLILSLQAMIMMASNDMESPLQVFDTDILEDIMSVFITSAVLKLMQAVLDIAFTWNARCTMNSSQLKKRVLKMVVAMIWTIILPILYSSSSKKYTCYSSENGSWLGEWCYSPYMVAVAIYLLTNALDMILFLVPAIGRYIETSNFRICTILSWWTQPRLYVGRGMQESQLSIMKYTLFWVLLLLSKFAFSYNFEIKPLIAPTRQIMKIGVKDYEWHELFPRVQSNAGAIIAIWTPIIMVYFMDIQIWYSVFCAIFGGFYGVLHHIGEIRTLGMLRSRFQALPAAFNHCFIPPPVKSKRSRKGLFNKRFQKVSHTEKKSLVKFVLVWNQIISRIREEDLMSNKEVDLMKIPFSPELLSGKIRWPAFLLANKVSVALCIAKDFVGKDANLLRKIKKDDYIYMSVMECYESLKNILEILVVGDLERRIISGIVDEIEESVGRSSLLEDLKMSALPCLHAKLIKMVELLVEGDEDHHDKVVKVLQDILEIVTNDMMLKGSRTLNALNADREIEAESAELFSHVVPELFASKHSIHFPLPDSNPLNEQIKRFLMLLTIEDTALDIPSNLEARRRITFFATSLFMDIPTAPKVRNMLSFSVLTPHYLEEVTFSTKELHSRQEGVSISFYMQRIYPDEWKNFLERIGAEDSGDTSDDIKEEDFRNWASYRGQTLSRTGAELFVLCS